MPGLPPKKNTIYILYIALPSQADTKLFQVNPTIAAGDFKVSTDGGALGNLTTLPVVTPAGSKMVKVTFSAAEMNGDNITLVGSDAAGAEWSDILINIPTTLQQIDDIPTAIENRTEMDSNSTRLADIEADTSNLFANQGAWLTATGFSTHSAGDVWLSVLEGATTARDMMRLNGAALWGKSSGGGTATLIFRDIADSKARITATVDANGNRTARVVDAT